MALQLRVGKSSSPMQKLKTPEVPFWDFANYMAFSTGVQPTLKLYARVL